jgi:phosphoribosylformimino-5-aminoimidazole carboxamide ribotide isomerase
MNELQIIPVVDILNGVAVQAIGGNRSNYRPIRSQLTDSVDPSIVLTHMCRVCHSDTAYVADLDAIMRQEPNRCMLAELARMPLNLMVDVGVQSSDDVQTLLDLGYSQTIVALESLPGPDIASTLVRTFNPDSLILSLDLNAGVPISRWKPWAQLPPLDLLCELSSLGFCRWIVLDLSTVGTSAGVPTHELCREWRRQRPHDEIITGGGIKDRSDLLPLKQVGIDGVLIASALHSGSISESPASER